MEREEAHLGHDQHFHEALLAPRAKPEQEHIQDRQIRGLRDRARPGVLREPHEAQRREHAQHQHGKTRRRVLLERRRRRMQEARLRIKPVRRVRWDKVRCELDAPRHTVARAGDQAEELRAGQHEVEDLREEEEKQGLRVVCLDAHDGKRHASHVAERIAGENTRGIPTTGMLNTRQDTRQWAVPVVV